MTTAVAAPPAEKVPEPAPEPRKKHNGALLTLVSILLALVIGGIIIALSDQVVRSELPHIFSDPGPFFRDFFLSIRDAYLALFNGAIFNVDNDGTFNGILGPIAGSLNQATPLILAGLGVAVAFRSGLFNIGGEGQVIAGAFCSGWVGLTLDLPAVVLLPLAIIAGIIGGLFWGAIAGWLKARTGAHEVITTIMLNWIATFSLVWLISLDGIVNPSNPQQSKSINESARIPSLLGSGLPVSWGLIVALVAALGVAWLLGRSKLGFQMRAVGANPAASRTAGISVGKVTVISMALAGGLAGLAGTTLALGGFTSYAVTPQISSNIGFDAITVALLGRSTPWGAVGAGLLFGFLKNGGATMQATAGVQVPIDIVTIIQALIVIFVAAPKLVGSIVRIKALAGSAMQTATTNLVTSVNQVRAARFPRHLFAGGMQIGISLVVLLLLGLVSGRSSGETTIRFNLRGDSVTIPDWTFTAQPMIIVVCVVAALAGVLRCLQKISPRWAIAIVALCLVFAVIAWWFAGSGTNFLLTRLLQGALFPLAIPLILGSLAGVIGERSGVVNIAIEGQLLGGAFLAAVLGTVTGSVWFGLAGGLLAGVLVAALLSVLAIKYFVDQVIVGVVLNLLVLGITSFLFTKLLSPNQEGFNDPPYFPVWKVPGLSDIPIIGNVFFSGTVFLYATYVLVALVHFGLFHTRWGLRLRAVGEHPRAADTVGIKVLRTRYRAVLLAGLLAGLGGAFLVLGNGSQGTFGLNMSSGSGFIALAAVIFGRWRPLGALAAALLFGFSNQLQSLMGQVTDAPIASQLLLTLPYVVTLFVVAGSGGRVRAPAADGQPYRTS